MDTQKIINNILGIELIQRKLKQNHPFGYGSSKRDKLLPGGGYCDASIYKFLVRINKTNYKTQESCSGLISEHLESKYLLEGFKKSFTGFLSFDNAPLKILNVTNGTKWIAAIAYYINSNYMYVDKRYISNKLFVKSRKAGKIKPLHLMPNGKYAVMFMLPPNLSEQEILHQWELITINIERM